MNVNRIAKELQLTRVTKHEEAEREITGGYTSDLLSNVMGQAKDGMVWVTMQGHHNIAAIGSLIGLAAIIVSGGTNIEQETITRADENELPIFSTDMSSYEVTGKLYALGIVNK